MKRTLKRELKVPEIAEREANGTSVSWGALLRAMVIACFLNASVVVGFDLDVRGGSCLVCQRQLMVEDNSRGMAVNLRVTECVW